MPEDNQRDHHLSSSPFAPYLLSEGVRLGSRVGIPVWLAIPVKVRSLFSNGVVRMAYRVDTEIDRLHSNPSNVLVICGYIEWTARKGSDIHFRANPAKTRDESGVITLERSVGRESPVVDGDQTFGGRDTR